MYTKFCTNKREARILAANNVPLYTADVFLDKNDNVWPVRNSDTDTPAWSLQALITLLPTLIFRRKDKIPFKPFLTHCGEGMYYCHYIRKTSNGVEYLYRGYDHSQMVNAVLETLEWYMRGSKEWTEVYGGIPGHHVCGVVNKLINPD